MKKLFTLLFILYLSAAVFGQHVKPKLAYPLAFKSAQATQFRTAAAAKQRLDSLKAVGDYKIIFTYNAGNYMTKSLGWEWVDEKWTRSNQTDLTYNSNNMVMVEINSYYNNDEVSGISKLEYTYDANNYKTTEIQYSSSDKGVTWSEDSKSEYTYDVSKNNTQILVYIRDDMEWVLDLKIVNTFDANARPLKEFRYHIEGEEWVYDLRSDYTYDVNGNKTEFTVYTIDGENETMVEKDEYAYDADHNTTTEAYYFSGENGLYGTIKYEYTFDKSVAKDNLIYPPLFEGYFTNKVTKEMGYRYDEETDDWPAVGVEGLYYYTNLDATSVTGKTTGNSADLKVYPNPASGAVSFDLNASAGSLVLELYDAQGKKSLSEQIENNKSLSVQHLQKGIYFYQIISQDSYVYNGTLILE